VSSDQVAAIGAFLSGMGSVLGAWFAIRSVRKRMQQECEERIKLLEHGIEIGRHEQ
jgi:hypothetical protein